MPVGTKENVDRLYKDTAHTWGPVNWDRGATFTESAPASPGGLGPLSDLVLSEVDEDMTLLSDDNPISAYGLRVEGPVIVAGDSPERPIVIDDHGSTPEKPITIDDEDDTDGEDAEAPLRGIKRRLDEPHESLKRSRWLEERTY